LSALGRTYFINKIYVTLSRKHSYLAASDFTCLISFVRRLTTTGRLYKLDKTFELDVLLVVIGLHPQKLLASVADDRETLSKQLAS